VIQLPRTTQDEAAAAALPRDRVGATPAAVTRPLALEPASWRARHSALGWTVPLPPPTVLLVGDALTRAALARVLCRDGFGVLEARDAADLVVRLESRRDDIDLVIADAALPGLGAEAVPRIRAVAPAVPVILIAGRGEGTQYRGARPPGVLAVLARPLDVLRLRALLRTYRTKEI
jgi:CheY-like chemotaxis protein